MVFQDARLLDHLSAFDNVALPLRINGAQDDQIGGFVSEMLGLARPVRPPLKPNRPTCQWASAS